MRFMLRGTALLAAVLIGLTGLWIAAHRRAPGVSMAAYTTLGSDRDIMLTWPGRPAVQRLDGGPGSQTNPIWSPVCCRIAFLTVGNQDMDRGVSVTGLRRNTTVRLPIELPLSETSPAWSPDGSTLALEADTGNQPDIWIVGADGRRITNMSDHPAYDFDPVWSPDGRRIAFISYRGGEAVNNGRIYVATLDDQWQVVGLRAITDHRASHTLAGWSPDGEWLLFTTMEAAQSPDLTLARADGSVIFLLASHSSADTSPAWSPDGQWIAFVSERSGSQDVYVVRPDGSGLRNVSDDPAHDRTPVWSPDGQWIAFMSTRGGQVDIYRVRPDGTDLRNLTHDPDPDFGPVWSPDGRWIAFEVVVNGLRQVYAVHPDGSGRVRLSRGIDAASNPAWSPPLALPFRPLILLGAAGLLLALSRGSKLVLAGKRAIMLLR